MTKNRYFACGAGCARIVPKSNSDPTVVMLLINWHGRNDGVAKVTGKLAGGRLIFERNGKERAGYPALFRAIEAEHAGQEI